jgi:hypothetical protein
MKARQQCATAFPHSCARRKDALGALDADIAELGLRVSGGKVPSAT